MYYKLYIIWYKAAIKFISIEISKEGKAKKKKKEEKQIYVCFLHCGNFSSPKMKS